MEAKDLIEGKPYKFHLIGKPAIYKGKRTNDEGDESFMFDFQGARHYCFPDKDGLVGFESVPNIEPIEDETSN